MEHTDEGIVGVVTQLKRGRNTLDGNPSWEITVSPGFTYKMKPNAGLGYLIGDWMLDREFLLTMERGKVIDMKPTDGVI